VQVTPRKLAKKIIITPRKSTENEATQIITTPRKSKENEVNNSSLSADDSNGACQNLSVFLNLECVSNFF